MSHSRVQEYVLLAFVRPCLMRGIDRDFGHSPPGILESKFKVSLDARSLRAPRNLI